MPPLVRFDRLQGRRFPLPLLVFLLLPILTGCGTSPAAHGAPPVVPGRDVAVWIHASDRSVHEIFLRNDSDGVYWIHAVILRDCMNVREACGSHEIDLVACPGETKPLLQVRPSDPASAFYFNWDWDAERYASAEDRIGLECGG